MEFGYLFTYSQEDIFFKSDVLSQFKDKQRTKNLLLKPQNNTSSNIFHVVAEYTANEFYKSYYNSDIKLYINECNYIIVSKQHLEEKELNNIRNKSPLILFFVDE